MTLRNSNSIVDFVSECSETPGILDLDNNSRVCFLNFIRAPNDYD